MVLGCRRKDVGWRREIAARQEPFMLKNVRI
jgi:hypothetical protein